MEEKLAEAKDQLHAAEEAVKEHGPRNARQLLRYVGVNAASFSCDLAVLSVLREVGALLQVAGVVGFAVGMAVNYLLSVRFVFDERRFEGHGKEIVGYVLIGLTGLALNSVVLWGVSTKGGQHYVLAKIASGFAVMLWTFTLRKTLLFSNRSPS